MIISTFGESPEKLILAIVFASAISFIAYRVRALTREGAAAATFVGSAIVAGSGWWSGGALVLFFVSATALSKVRLTRSSEIGQQRGLRRDAIQVFANGGVPALMSLTGWISGSEYWTVGALCAISAAASDTWATEIGRLTQWPPRSIVNGTRVPVGTSGAVSVPGTAGSLVGSLVIAGYAAIGVTNDWLQAGVNLFELFVVISTAGFAGSLLDSFLGATVQESFYCENCRVNTELRTHRCGTNTIRAGGIAGINNDVINLVSVTVPATLAVLVVLATG